MAIGIYWKLRRRWLRLTGQRSANAPEELLIIATQRTGSNFLSECLRAFARTLVLREIFHNRSVLGANGQSYVLDELGKRLGLPISSSSEPELVSFFRREPARAWSMLAEIAASHRRKLLTFKIFDRQLPVDHLAPILKARKPAVIFLVRCRLDVYISLMKAKAVGGWSKADTTATKISISAEEFLEWSKGVDLWYQETSQLADRLRLRRLVLRYDDHVKADKERVVSLLQRALEELGIKVSQLPEIPPGTYFKQDRRSSPFDRIGNGQDVKAKLTALGLLDYALQSPLADRVWAARP